MNIELQENNCYLKVVNNEFYPYSKLTSYLIPDLLLNSSQARKTEFLRGRLCVNLALAQAGHKEIQLSINSDRSPEWPMLLVGSISHSKLLTGAVVAYRSRFRSVGLDLELVGRIRNSVEKIISNEDDLSESDIVDDEELKVLIFSAKESLFKMLHPIEKKFFGFDAACITSINTKEFTIKLREDVGCFLQGREFRGEYHFFDNHVLTFIALAN